MLPVALWGEHAPPERARRFAHLALAGLAALAVISPWVIRNNIRFDETVTMSTQDGLTLIGTNCPPAFEGPGRGFWHLSCALDVPIPEGADQSVRSAIYRDEAFDYLGDNIDRLPSVIVARLGRGLSLWQNDAMNSFNQGEGREAGASRIGVWQFWMLTPFALYGLIRWPVAQRRDPMLAMFAMSLLTIAALYGIPRFRIAAEVAIVVCAAIGVVTLWRRRSVDG